MRESPSTSLRSLPFFINTSRFSGWAVILSKDVGHYLKPINNLLILSFHSLKSLWLTEKKLELITIELIDRIFIHLISEFSHRTCSYWKGERSFQVYYKNAFGESFQFHLTWIFVPWIAQQILKEFNKKKSRIKSPCV